MLSLTVIYTECRPSGWSMCLPLLIFPCTIKSRSSLLAPAHPGSPGKMAVKRLWCVVVLNSCESAGHLTGKSSTKTLLLRTLVIQREQSLCCLCVWTMTFEPNDLWCCVADIQSQGHRSKFRVTGGKCSFFNQWCMLQGKISRMWLKADLNLKCK